MRWPLCCWAESRPGYWPFPNGNWTELPLCQACRHLALSIICAVWLIARDLSGSSSYSHPTLSVVIQYAHYRTNEPVCYFWDRNCSGMGIGVVLQARVGDVCQVQHVQQSTSIRPQSIHLLHWGMQEHKAIWPYMFTLVP